MEERILVAVDESEASEKAVRYVGRMLSGSDSSRVTLFSLLQPPPKSFDMAGIHGTMGPLPAEQASDPALGDLYRHAQREAKPIFERMTRALQDAGFDPGRVDTDWAMATWEDYLDKEILAEAERRNCGTIVVGRHAMSGVRELLHTHVADGLVKEANGRTLWVVE